MAVIRRVNRTLSQPEVMTLAEAILEDPGLATTLAVLDRLRRQRDTAATDARLRAMLATYAGARSAAVAGALPAGSGGAPVQGPRGGIR